MRTAIITLVVAAACVCVVAGAVCAWYFTRGHKAQRRRSVAKCDLITSKGYDADVRSPEARAYAAARRTEMLTAPDALLRAYQDGQDGDVVWLRLGSHRTTGDLDTFSQHVLPHLRYAFVLVTTDGDSSVPGAFKCVDSILRSERIIAWYTQNCDNPDYHAKLRPLPIGLNAHDYGGAVPRDLCAHFEAVRSSMPFEARADRILVDVLSKSHKERVRVAALIDAHPNDARFDVIRERVPIGEIHERYARNKYVLSVRGNGLDCHRTWEALAAGSVVIVRTSPLDPLYRHVAGAVCILQRWEELLDPGIFERLREYAPLRTLAPLSVSRFAFIPQSST